MATLDTVEDGYPENDERETTKAANDTDVRDLLPREAALAVPVTTLGLGTEVSANAGSTWRTRSLYDSAML
jgi:hypothetical protein